MFPSFMIECIENLCDMVGKHLWIIFVAYIFQVNQCRPLVVHAHTLVDQKPRYKCHYFGQHSSCLFLLCNKCIY
jgi:hypothetical protein